MINLLRKLFIKDYNNISNPTVRLAHGKMASILGLISNAFLFCIKLIIGIVTFSVSIISDSINNLSDFATSIVTLIGFKMSNKPADKKHPYGHERSEYIAGLIVALVIIFVGGTLFLESLNRVINYKEEDINQTILIISIAVLVLAIFIKMWQAFAYKTISKLIKSSALDAASKDSLFDCISTSAVLIGTVVILLSKLIGFRIPFSVDGILGILVSIFILISGIVLVREESDPLLGEALSKGDFKELVSYIESYDIVLRTHDLIVHNYGPSVTYVTIHVEFDAKKDIFLVHDEIDEIEENVKKKFGYKLTIHMDPVDLGDIETNELMKNVSCYLKELDEKITLHDFRIRRKKNENILLFDVLVPYGIKYSEDELNKLICDYINSNREDKYNVKITFDHEMFKD